MRGDLGMIRSTEMARGMDEVHTVASQTSQGERLRIVGHGHIV